MKSLTLAPEHAETLATLRTRRETLTAQLEQTQTETQLAAAAIYAAGPYPLDVIADQIGYSVSSTHRIIRAGHKATR